MNSNLENRRPVYSISLLDDLICRFGDILSDFNEDSSVRFSDSEWLCKVSRSIVLVYQKLWHKEGAELEPQSQQLAALLEASSALVSRAKESAKDEFESKMIQSFFDHIQNRLHWVKYANNTSISLEERVRNLILIDYDLDQCDGKFSESDLDELVREEFIDVAN